MSSLLLVLAAGLVPFVRPAQASSIGAFITPPMLGTQILYQNKTTGDITHSLCNSPNVTIFPTDPPRSLALPYPAKNGTSIAVLGWYDGASVWATVFYQSNTNNLIHSVWQCDTKTGDYIPRDKHIVSAADGTPDIHNSSGVAANLLGESAGEHLYYHDTTKRLHYNKYTNDQGWTYGGKVSPDQNLGSMALATAFIGSNETIFTSKDKSNIEMSVWNTDKTYHVSTFPQTLKDAGYSSESNNTKPAFSTSDKPDTSLTSWDGTAGGALAVSIDRESTKYVFYIGGDKKLHLATSSLDSGKTKDYAMHSDLDASMWPVADEANAQLAVAYNSGDYTIRVVYQSNRTLVIAAQQDKKDGWVSATTVSQANATTSNPADSVDSSGLSTGAKAGIGVGVALGVLLIIGAIVAFFCLHRRRRHRRKEAVRQSQTNANMVVGPDGQMVPAGQSGYDYGQATQWDYTQQPYDPQNSWGADKKAMSPTPDMYGQPVPVTVEMPDNSPTHHRMSELPTAAHFSHELPGGGLGQIHEGAPSVQEGHIAPADSSAHQRSVSEGAVGNMAVPVGSLPQRTVSAASPPPQYVSQSTSPASANVAMFHQNMYEPTQPVSPTMAGLSNEFPQHQQPAVSLQQGGPIHEEQAHQQQQGYEPEQQTQHQQQQYYDPEQQHMQSQQQQYYHREQQNTQHQQQYYDPDQQQQHQESHQYYAPEPQQVQQQQHQQFYEPEQQQQQQHQLQHQYSQYYDHQDQQQQPHYEPQQQQRQQQYYEPQQSQQQYEQQLLPQHQPSVRSSHQQQQ